MKGYVDCDRTLRQTNHKLKQGLRTLFQPVQVRGHKVCPQIPLVFPNAVNMERNRGCNRGWWGEWKEVFTVMAFFQKRSLVKKRIIRYRGIEKTRGVQSHFSSVTFLQSLAPKQGLRHPTIQDKLEARGYVLKHHSLNVPQCNLEKNKKQLVRRVVAGLYFNSDISGRKMMQGWVNIHLLLHI